MSDSTLLTRSVEAIRRLRSEVETLRSRAAEPIAVVGLGCRFPGGADDPERFWRLLTEGADPIAEVPADRWDVARYHATRRDEPGTSYTRHGGFLDDPYAFDFDFFGISVAEAAEMDPQQRLLLQCGWEALETGGLVSPRLAGERIAVFAGISGSENALLPRPAAAAGPYTATGSAISIAAGRVAHALGLRGPVLAVDTACSSSLVAVHLAVESLRRGECTAALAGGVSALLSPAVFVALSRMEALAADGRCKTFDATADGYGRSEGCGMVALMRAGDARAAGAPVLALIRGSAVNHDGRTGGLTVPSGPAQRELITAALTAAGTSGAEVGYLEAHGTGTPLGDPIEVRAAAEAYAAGRDPGDPLLIGAVKSNIGHLEAAAGVAGLIKTVLALRHRVVPGNLHLTELNPRMDAGRLPVAFCDRTRPWPDRPGPAVAAVSSFGFSGTNAHLILQEAPPEPPAPSAVDRPAHVLALSARDADEVRTVAARLADWITEHPGVAVGDVGHTVNARRAAYPCRVALITSSVTDAVARLRDLPEPARAGPPGRLLLHLSATPAEADAIAAALRPVSAPFRDAWDRIAAEVADQPGATGPDARAVITQIALARMLGGWGVGPAAVAGAGPGELAAASVAGIFDPATAVRLLLARSTGAVPEATFPAPRTRLLRGAGASAVPAGSRAADWVAADGATPPDVARKTLEDHGYGQYLRIGGEPAPGWSVVTGSAPWLSLLETLAARHTAGGDIDWTAVDEGHARRRLPLPPHPLRRLSPRPAPSEPALAPAALARVAGLGLREIGSPLPQRLFQATIVAGALPELADTAGVLHVGWHQELLATVARDAFDAPLGLTDVAFQQALRPVDGDRVVQIVVEPPVDGWAAFATHSRGTGDTRWIRHVTGRLRAGSSGALPDVAPPRPPAGRGLDGAAFNAGMRRRGVALGPSVEWADEVWTGEGEVLARFRPPGGPATGRTLPVPPGLLDACMQLYALVAGPAVADDELFLTSRADDVRFSAEPPAPGPLWCRVRLTGPPGDGAVRASYELVDSGGAPVVTVGGAEIRLLGPASHPPPAETGTGLARTRPRPEALDGYLRDLVAELVRLPTGELDPDVPLADAGMESLAALELRRRVRAELDVELPVELLLDGPSLTGLRDAVLAHTGRTGAAEPPRDYQTESGRWLPRIVRPADAVRLFCLPYGGGGASLFRHWPEQLPGGVAVHPVQLPGREDRADERAIDDLDEAVDVLTRALKPHLDRPFAFYGHSMGGLLAYRLAHRLSAEYGDLLRHVFVGAFSAPADGPNPLVARLSRVLDTIGLAGLPDGAEVARARRERPEVFQAALRDEFGAALATKVDAATDGPGYHDLRLVWSHRPQPGEALPAVPLTALHGTGDEVVAGADMLAWAGLTRGRFELVGVPGNHFFVHEDQSGGRVRALLAARLAEQVLAAPGALGG
ncbi:beta-ketoacyl synthase N-terminal-like domain-containing protein [Micromonospora sp. NPDC048898]|uniref:beta-ketoacyl synthase N-terminal-like domain-containing protein n=1 Tax=Micromonospora sp. NPDC048898 TaxID=3364260 RepID=UPI003722FF88